MCAPEEDLPLTRTERRILEAAEGLFGVALSEPPEPEGGPRVQVAELLASAGLTEAQVDAAVARAFQGLREESDRRARGSGPALPEDAAGARARESREAAGRLVSALDKILDRLGVRAQEGDRTWRSRARKS